MDENSKPPIPALSWDVWFLLLTKLLSRKSKDRSTPSGAVIVGTAHTILATGYNGFPQGTDDNVESRHVRPKKYMWMEHAERNAINFAARNGTKIDGATVYVNWMPCASCARSIINSGIREVVFDEAMAGYGKDRWGEEHANATEMLAEAGVLVRTYAVPYQLDIVANVPKRAFPPDVL